MPLRKPKKPPDPNPSPLPRQLPSWFTHTDLFDLSSPYLLYLPPSVDVVRFTEIGDVCPRFFAVSEPVEVVVSRNWRRHTRSSAWPQLRLPSESFCSRSMARYGPTLMGDDSVSNSGQVRTIYPLFVRDSLNLGGLISRIWWSGLVLVGYSILFNACEYCVCRSDILWWFLSVRVVVAINGYALCLMGACLSGVPLPAPENFFMASSSPSPPASKSPQNALPCPDEGSASPPPLSNQPLSLPSGSYSEALALGGGGQGSNQGTRCPPLTPQVSKPGFTVCWLFFCIHLQWLLYLSPFLCWLNISMTFQWLLYLSMLRRLLSVIVAFTKLFINAML